jgi:hypothetical protein
MLLLSIQNTLYKLENESELKKQLFAKYSPDEIVEVKSKKWIFGRKKVIEVCTLRDIYPYYETNE